jgi:phage shock protein PspC (stress-responsive transcriptional regulator)
VGVLGVAGPRWPGGTFAEALLTVPPFGAGPPAAAPTRGWVVLRPARSRTTSPAATVDAPSATFTEQPGARQLRRSGDDRMLADVGGGIAHYPNTDAALVRVMVAVLVLFTCADAALYLAAWTLIPPTARASRSPRRSSPAAGTATANKATNSRHQRIPIIMPAVIALVLAAIMALAVLGFAMRLFFSPWLLLAAVADLVLIRFRPRRSHR